jgi:hypothetical protein
VPGLGPLGLAFCALIGLQREIGGGLRGTEEPLPGLALLITRLLLEILIFFEQLVDLALFLKTTRTIADPCRQAGSPLIGSSAGASNLPGLPDSGG